jgi:leader peptidase (prepilin peptidase) / N-methyltransferase
MDDSWGARFTEWWLTDPSLFRMPFHFWSGVLFLLGSFTGSFLNVCIHRMPLGQSVVHPPSHCPKCGHRIPLILNIPLVTWLWLRGRCANCRDTISPRYFAVELLTGLTFWITWLYFGRQQPALAGALCVLFSLFIVATFIDFEHLIIPDEITLGGAVAGLILSGLVPDLHQVGSAGAGLLKSLLGLTLGVVLVLGVVQLGKVMFGRQRVELSPDSRVHLHETGLNLPGQDSIPFEDIFFRRTDTLRFQGRRIDLADRCYVLADVSLNAERLQVGSDSFKPEEEPFLGATTDEIVLPREAMGLGDVKFMATIGAFLGWQATVFALGVASFVGAIIGVGLIVAGRREWSSRLPFGPYLALGAVVWAFGGQLWWATLWSGTQ